MKEADNKVSLLSLCLASWWNSPPLLNHPFASILYMQGYTSIYSINLIMWIHNNCISVKCKFVEQNNSVPIRVVKHSGNGIAVFCIKYDNAVCLLQILTSNRGCYTFK